MKFIFLLSFLVACASPAPKKQKEAKLDADLACKLASLEFPSTAEKSTGKKSMSEVLEIRSAMQTMLPGLRACAKAEKNVSEIGVCYVFGTDAKGKTIYSKFYSHDDKKFSPEFFSCLDQQSKQMNLSRFKSVKVTQPITLKN